MNARDRPTRLVLASASPARLATLRAAGVSPEVMVSDVDEAALIAAAGQAGNADPQSLVSMLARAKALDVARRVADPAAIVIGCDSMLDLDGRAYGKPASPDDAMARWRQMRGRTGVLRTGHALVTGAAVRVAASAAVVRFADVDDAEISAYVATGEPLAVAGAFTIDGLGGWFIEGIEGDHHGVVGISLPLLRSMLRSAGVTLAALWAERRLRDT